MRVHRALLVTAVLLPCLSGCSVLFDTTDYTNGTGKRDGGGVDAGSCDAAPAPDPWSGGAPCSVETARCVYGYCLAPDAPDECVGVCTEAYEPGDSGCDSCTITNVIACGAENCTGEWQAMDCCTQDSCPTRDDACIEAMCGPEGTAFVTCTGEAGCLDRALDCMPCAGEDVPPIESRPCTGDFGMCTDAMACDETADPESRRHCFEMCAVMASSDCDVCVRQNFVACGIMNGCEGEWDALRCCARPEGCADPLDAECALVPCTMEVGDFTTCGDLADCGGAARVACEP